MAGTEKKGVIIDLGADVSKINKALREVKGEIISLQKDFNSLKKETSFDDTHIKGLRQQFEILGKTVDAQQDKIKLYDAKLKVLNDSLEKTGDELREATEKYGANSKEVQELTQKHDALQDAIDKLNREREREQNLVDGNLSQLRSMEKEINSVSSTYNIYASTFESDSQRIRNSIEEIDDRFSAFNKLTKFDTTKITAFANQLDLLGQKVEQQESLLNLYDQRIVQVTSAMEEARQKVVRTAQAYGDNSDEVTKADAEYQNLYAQLTKLNSERDAEKIALQTTQAEYNDLSQKIDNTADAQKRLDSATGMVTGKVDALTIALGNLISNGVDFAVDKLRDLATQVYEVGTGFEDATTELAAVLELSKYSDTIGELSGYFEELSLSSKYSAEEIANNATVLANAGYSADEIKDSLKAISDLAIGTGEDFATMANVTVDGLASMGYAASDAQHFVDVLAKSAIVSNTDVTQMGEALQYAGSVAGTFGYSVEDVTIALGAMATQGVKSTSAGTALRSLITRLAANTSDARTEFEKLGGTFFDTEGNAVPLKNVLDDLRRTIGNMNDEQAAAFEYTLAGQRGLTGLSAIINTTTEDWEDLSTAVYDYNGTVAGMTNTRMDSLSGDVAILKNNWEDVTRELYSGVEPSVRKVTNSLSKMMQSEAFRGDVEKMADDASEAFEWLAKVIESTDGNIIDMATDVIQLVASFAGVTLITKNVINLGNGVAGLVSALKGVSSASGFFSALASNAGIASVAVGLGATAFVALGDAMLDAQEASFEQIEAQWGLSEAAQETVDKIDALYVSYENARTATQQNVDSINAEYAGYEALIAEYDSLLDANGNVMLGYEDRANVILTTLSEAMGVEVSQLQGLVGEYGNLSLAMEDLMVKKKADAVLTAYTEEYATAVKKVGQATIERSNALAALQEQQEKTRIAEENYNIALAQQTIEVEKYGFATQETKDRVNAAQREYATASGALSELQTRYDNADKACSDWNTTIQNYQGLSSAIIEGDTTKIEQALDDMTWGFQHAETSSVESMQRQVIRAREEYERLLQAVKNGDTTVTNEMISEAYNRLSKCEVEYKKFTKMAADQATESGQEYTNNIDSEMSKAPGKVLKHMQDLQKEMRIDMSADGNWSASQYTSGLTGGIYSGIPAIKAAAQAAANAATVRLNKTMLIQSPSRVTMKTGEYFSEGFAIGIEKKFAEIREMAGEAGLIADEALSNAYMNAHGVAPITNNNTTNSTFNPIINVSVYGGSNETDEQFANRIADVINEKTMRLKQVW